MKLLTHNYITSQFLKGVVNGYPLILSATEKKISEQQFNDGLVKVLLKKIDYPVLRQAAESIGEAEGLPNEISSHIEEDNTFLRKLFHVLVEVEVVEGELKCPETGRIFPIRSGIPNLLVDEESVS